jgi:S-adenosylmethionine decarboxylase proenzyme
MGQIEDSGKFEFYGRHLLLDFRGCRVDLNDVERLKQDMIAAVTSVGATVLNCVWHKFEPNGVSLVLLLAESHASVHTYPEERACFIDLFTCGRRIRVEPFAEIMADCWQPETVARELRERCDPAEPRVGSMAAAASA